MFPSERDSLVRREHYKDLLRQAKRARLVRQRYPEPVEGMQAGQERRNHFSCRALTWLGRRLVVWGWRLQKRYGAATTAPAFRAANRTR